MTVTIESEPTGKQAFTFVARIGLVILGDTVTLQLAEAQLARRNHRPAATTAGLRRRSQVTRPAAPCTAGWGESRRLGEYSVP